jgi:hypothetical protein
MESIAGMIFAHKARPPFEGQAVLWGRVSGEISKLNLQRLQSLTNALGSFFWVNLPGVY